MRDSPDRNGRVLHYSPLKQTVNATSITSLATFVKLTLYQVVVVILGPIFWRIVQAKSRFEISIANEE